MCFGIHICMEMSQLAQIIQNEFRMNSFSRKEFNFNLEIDQKLLKKSSFCSQIDSTF